MIVTTYLMTMEIFIGVFVCLWTESSKNREIQVLVAGEKLNRPQVVVWQNEVFIFAITSLYIDRCRNIEIPFSFPTYKLSMRPMVINVRFVLSAAPVYWSIWEILRAVKGWREQRCCWAFKITQWRRSWELHKVRL